MSGIGVPSPERVLEDIYAVTDEWEWVPLRMPPFDKFEGYGVPVEDVAELLVVLRRKYEFEVTMCPECPMDVVDMVLGRENTREVIRVRAERYDRMFVRVNARYSSVRGEERKRRTVNYI